MIIPSVPKSAEWRRIDAIPRRTYTPDEQADIVERMTLALRSKLGTQRLLPAQAIALLELGMYERLLCPLRPGAGKSLVCYLAPYVLERKRAVLLLPGKHVESKRRELVRYAVNWRVAWWIRFLSYQSLSRVSHADFLDTFQPDLILADEAHKLKNPRAGCTRRIRNYLASEAGRACTFVPLSGTFSDRNPGDWGHLAEMALSESSPLPASYQDMKLWIQALGEKLSGPRARPGALCAWSENGSSDLDDVRKGFAARVRETPAVVATESPLPSITLVVERHELPSDPAIEDAFKELRSSWCAPDGWPLTQGLQVWALARQLKCGFYYYHYPRPESEYLARRKAWGQFVRQALIRHQTLVTELQIVNACRSGDLDPTAYLAWKEIEPTYTGQRYAKWLSATCLEWCRDWLREPGLLWAEHTEFATALSSLTGVPYHGAGGLDAKGVLLESRKGEPVISGMGGSEGLNLQHAYSRNLVVCPPGLGRAWEQLLARTHRLGQLADEVTVDVLSGCRADETAWEQAVADARYLSDSDCLQRLEVADKIWEADLRELVRKGHRWRDLSKP